MCILKKFWVGVFIIFSNGLLSMVYAFDLVEAYRNALVYNADYLRSIAENTAGQEKRVQGLSALLPQISVNGAYNENYVNLPATANGGVAGFFHQPVLGATLNQVIFDFSKFSLRKRNRGLSTKRYPGNENRTSGSIYHGRNGLFS